MRTAGAESFWTRSSAPLLGQLWSITSASAPGVVVNATGPSFDICATAGQISGGRGSRSSKLSHLVEPIPHGSRSGANKILPPIALEEAQPSPRAQQALAELASRCGPAALRAHTYARARAATAALGQPLSSRFSSVSIGLARF